MSLIGIKAAPGTSEVDDCGLLVDIPLPTNSLTQALNNEIDSTRS